MLISRTQLVTMERCSGHAGISGVKKAHHADATKISRPVFKLVGAQISHQISSGFQLAGHHIEQGIRDIDISSGRRAHP